MELSGLVISEPVLHSAFPRGPEVPDEYLYRRFRREWEKFDIKKKSDEPRYQTQWLDFILEEFLEIEGDNWKKKNEVPMELKVQLLEFSQKLVPSRVLIDREGNPLLLVSIVPPTQSLKKPETKTGRWKASPLTKLDRLLRETKVPLGLLTNGIDFTLLYAAPGLTTASITWTAQSFVDEKSTLDSFYTLLNKERFFGPEEKRLLSLVQESQKRQTDVTDQLGEQVRQALDLFIRALDDVDRKEGGRLLSGMSEEEIYEMALIVMMRKVFLLYAEENLLLPHDEMLYDNAYGITHLWFELERARGQDPESLKESYDAWPRLLATFRLVYYGCPHPDLNMRAYGGRLFDPARFPVLEDERLKISNEVIYQIIKKLTFARVKMGKEWVKQRVSYRALDIEQIGSVYEGLMEYKIKVAEEDLVVFRGKKEAIRPASELITKSGEELVKYLKDTTGFTVNKIKKLLEQNSSQPSLTDFSQWSSAEAGLAVAESREPYRARLAQALEPFKDFVHLDRIINQGSRYMAHTGSERKGSGSFYTPKQLTSFLVKQALEPLVYNDNGEIKSPEEILSIKVCDPAMGSGAFLVQAVRYLAEKLVESWDVLQAKNPGKKLTMPYGKPQNGDLDERLMELDRESALTWAKRFVAERCIYGVDLNPLAVDLAKMSLWLVTLSKDKPFTFLDHRLKCGNSLIGAEFSRLDSIPSEPLWKEDKKHNNKILKQNLGPISEISIDKLLKDLIENRKDLDAPALNILDINKKEKLLEKIESEESRYSKLKKIMDLWCSVWFWPIEEEKGRKKKEVSLEAFGSVSGSSVNKEVALPPPHTNIYRQIVKYIATGVSDIYSVDRMERYLELSRQVAEEQRFFHWELEFPEVFRNPDGTPKENPGFDAVVGNPPWEIVKPNSQEFFSEFDPDFRSYPKQKAVKVMEELLKNDFIADLWGKYVKDIENQSYFFRNSRYYPHLGSGDINTYKLFLERFYHQLRGEGNLSIIVPSGLYTDKGCMDLRKLFLKKSRIRALISIENREKPFPIDSRFKFVLFTAQKGGTTEKFRTGFFIGKRTEEDKDRVLKPRELLAKSYPPKMEELGPLLERVLSHGLLMDGKLIEKFSPDTLSIMEFKRQEDIDITSKIYDDHPLLGEEIEGTWNVKFTTEFHMTNDSHLFFTKEQLERMGAVPDRDGRRWTGPHGERYLPLYEGKMIWQFSHLYSFPNYWLSENIITERMKEKEIDSNTYKSAYRALAANTNERTLIASVVSFGVGCGHSLNSISGENLRNRNLVFVTTLFDSFVIDWLLRQKVTTNLTMFFLYSLPLPRLTSGNWYFDQLVPRAARLICTTEEFADLWKEVYRPEWNKLSVKDGGTSMLEDWDRLTPEWGEHCGVYGWDETKHDIGDRAQLRCEIDALVAHLYGLNKEELEYILSTFPLVKEKSPWLIEGTISEFERLEGVVPKVGGGEKKNG